MKIKNMLWMVLLFTSLNAFAKTPSEVAANYYGALKQKDYVAAAKFFAPSALAEFRQNLAFMNELPDGGGKFFGTFFGAGASKESVGKLSNVDFFAAFMRAVMAQAETVGGANFGKMEILGEVPEGKDKVHVLSRNRVSVGELEMESMDVASVALVDGEWKMLMSGKIKGMAAQLKAALKRK